MNTTTPTTVSPEWIGHVHVIENMGRHSPVITRGCVSIIRGAALPHYRGIMGIPYRDQNAVRWMIRMIRKVGPAAAYPVSNFIVVEKDGGWALHVYDYHASELSPSPTASTLYGILLAAIKFHARNPVTRGHKRDNARRERVAARGRISRCDREDFHADA